MRIQFCNAPKILSVFGALGLILLLGTNAHAAKWYLMTADQKAMSNPSVARRLYQGARIGPVELTSKGEYSSRKECDSPRQVLIETWRKDSVIKRGAWDQYRINSPSEFIRCVPSTDPHLTKSSGDDRSATGRSLEIYIKNGFGR
jgi:hypothetical protein